MDPKHVLLVEDDWALREMVALFLRLKGYVVAGAENGLEALAHLRASERPSVILLDLMMPVMDGVQFRDEQQHDSALAAIPVVIISASSTVEAQAGALGAAGYLQKPVDFDALALAVERCAAAVG